MRISGYGDMTGTVTVQAQKATKIDILTTKIGLGNNLGSQQRIYYKVLNQYGNDMGISSNKLTINATNMSKNHTIQPTSYPNKTNTYFIVSTSQLTDAIGDKIVVVVYLQNDVSVNVSATLEIANIYTKTFTFGEADKAKDAHFYVDKSDYSYSLPYTTTDSEGNKVLLEKTTSTLGNSNSANTINNITFVSSNPSTIDPADFKIDSDGKLTFKTGQYASTFTITALNTVTDETTNINVTVGEKPKLSKVEVTDVTVPQHFATATGKVKAEIIGYDQYGTVISPANMANLNLSSDFTLTGSACTPTNSTTTTAKVTKDGKYVEFSVLNTALNSAAVGAKFNVTFIPKTNATLSSNATFIIGDATVAVTVNTYDDNNHHAVVDTKVENLTFKNGVATATGDADVDEAVAGNINVNAPSEASKYGVAVSGSAITVTAQNGVGETVTGYAGNKAISVKVEKKTATSTVDVTDQFINAVDKNGIVTFRTGVYTFTSNGNIPGATDDVKYTITVTEQGGKIVGSADVK